MTLTYPYLTTPPDLTRYRGLGIAQKLGRALIEHAQQSGFSQVFLVTSSGQHAALKLYAKLGWKVEWVKRDGLFKFYKLVLDLAQSTQ